MAEPKFSRNAAEVRFIRTEETWPLRLAVLRPGRPIESVRFPGDDAPTTRHFGAFREGHLLGIASLYSAEMPERPGLPAFQLRGMATAPEARGRGLGRALVCASIAFTCEGDVQLLWCNARSGAVGFYRKLGFEIVGGEFEIPDVGPHFRMVLRVTDRKPMAAFQSQPSA
jgi:ribosomal protein S18 acetylase RimI-like enzyme